MAGKTKKDDDSDYEPEDDAVALMNNDDDDGASSTYSTDSSGEDESPYPKLPTIDPPPLRSSDNLSRSGRYLDDARRLWCTNNTPGGQEVRSAYEMYCPFDECLAKKRKTHGLVRYLKRHVRNHHVREKHFIVKDGEVGQRRVNLDLGKVGLGVCFTHGFILHQTTLVPSTCTTSAIVCMTKCVQCVQEGTTEPMPVTPVPDADCTNKFGATMLTVPKYLKVGEEEPVAAGIILQPTQWVPEAVAVDSAANSDIKAAAVSRKATSKPSRLSKSQQPTPTPPVKRETVDAPQRPNRKKRKLESMEAADDGVNVVVADKHEPMIIDDSVDGLEVGKPNANMEIDDPPEEPAKADRRSIRTEFSKKVSTYDGQLFKNTCRALVHKKLLKYAPEVWQCDGITLNRKDMLSLDTSAPNDKSTGARWLNDGIIQFMMLLVNRSSLNGSKFALDPRQVDIIHE